MQTPLMAQYSRIKSQYPDTILLFRMGDFFETFEEDARIAAKVLGITLTRRANGAAEDVPLAGFPHHAIDSYLPKLVRAGYRVAVCEQIENPKFAKGIVKRDVIEVVTPGVAFSEKLLDHKKNNYLMGIYIIDDSAGISFCDISTGEFYSYESSLKELTQQIESISPSEILVQRKEKDYITGIVNRINPSIRVTRLDDWIFNYDYARELLIMQFKTVNLKGFGIEGLTAGIISCGAVLNYLQETQKANLSHLNKISQFNSTDHMVLDFATKRNLEITYSMQDGGREGSLISILDKTETAMGGRLLKKWITQPLRRLAPLLKRQVAVTELVNNKPLRKQLAVELSEIGDLERLISKVCTGRANPREVVSLRSSLKKIPLVKDLLKEADSESLAEIRERLSPLEVLTAKLDNALIDNPPLSIADGGVIKGRYSPELDELRDIIMNGKDWIARLQREEREKTGISSLKVNFNKVFGYYIEISNAHKEKVPADYIRKQTLVNSERYITSDLKVYEDKILHAEEKIYDLETQIFNQIRLMISDEAEHIQNNARYTGILDCLNSLAACAEEYHYIRPELNESTVLDIKEARHPVVEQILSPGEKFTPNDYYLNNQENQIIILTGPNMSGKSVYLRQLGLIVLLAQIGAYVPASEASIGLVDRIFTRVGASDNITSGESTFLVEMQEAANILNNATDKSLILLDEIGRGTSTFDGISIAWAITEFLHENGQVAAKTLFATHYHELNELAQIFPRIKNYKVEVREIEDKVIFLHKVTKGGADHSYGIQVAQMAGLPRYVTNRAKEILENLENKELTPYELKKEKLRKIAQENDNQISLFEFKDDGLRDQINEIEIDSITPLEALNKLSELKRRVKEKN